MSDPTRLPLVDVDTADEIAGDVFREIERIRGEVTNLFRMVANEPTLLPAFFGLSRRVRDESTLPPRLSQLAILTTALAIGNGYEIAHHAPEAERVGITPDEVARLTDPDLDAFSKDERSVISYARQVASARRVDEATFRDLVDVLGTSRTVELAVVVGWYHLVAAVVGPLEVAVEPDRARWEGSEIGTSAPPSGALAPPVGHEERG